jgi:hypothetical protein
MAPAWHALLSEFTAAHPPTFFFFDLENSGNTEPIFKISIGGLHLSLTGFLRA